MDKECIQKVIMVIFCANKFTWIILNKSMSCVKCNSTNV